MYYSFKLCPNILKGSVKLGMIPTSSRVTSKNKCTDFESSTCSFKENLKKDQYIRRKWKSPQPPTPETSVMTCCWKCLWAFIYECVSPIGEIMVYLQTVFYLPIVSCLIIFKVPCEHFEGLHSMSFKILWNTGSFRKNSYIFPVPLFIVVVFPIPSFES